MLALKDLKNACEREQLLQIKEKKLNHRLIKKRMKKLAAWYETNPNLGDD